MPESRKPPEWVYKDRRPGTDREYFENMTRCIFQGGLNWRMIANKWPSFREAFDGFDVDKVAEYGVDDIARLREDEGIIRNRQKIMATIENAEEFRRIASEHGSFQRWLDGIDKSNNYSFVAKRLKSRFKRIGVSTAHIFLWSVGEPIEYEPDLHRRRPKEIV
ncbi:DNA-3-methyladenine glycosylase I [Candidatus Bathyarchaeota archaeon]|nr:DNA-3-methyladenine glycosylase I [Candidatus Bathyarchaeota archaeon]